MSYYCILTSEVHPVNFILLLSQIYLSNATSMACNQANQNSSKRIEYNWNLK